jgi:hypothetical protein
LRTLALALAANLAANLNANLAANLAAPHIHPGALPCVSRFGETFLKHLKDLNAMLSTIFNIRKPTESKRR